MKIHLVLDCLDYGDGVSNCTLIQQSMFQKMGYECEIYSLFFEDRMKESRTDIDQLSAKPEDLLIHHYSGYSRIQPVVKKQRCKKVMVYHNITPPDYVEGPVKSDCEAGLKQVAQLGGDYDYVVGDSQFNLDCLTELGMLKKGEGDVLPIPVEFSGKPRIPKIRGAREGVRFLFVGRYAPNKKLEDVIRTFVYYHDRIDPAARLRLVGNPNVMEKYTETLRHLVEQANCRDSIELTGKVTDEELERIYNDSDVYLCMSEHEGFCIPLLEAMWHRLPVFAYDAGAVRETMGSGGVVFTDKTPVAVAQLIAEVLKDSALVQSILERQDRRVKEFSCENIYQQLKQLTEKWTGRGAESIQETSPHRLKKLKIQMQGPFETSYSLAGVNRNLIEAMHKLGLADVSIHCTEGPGDYFPEEKNLRDKQLARYLWQREKSFGVPDVAIRNMFPPRTTGLTAQMNFQAFGWEEDRIPAEYIEWFNRDLDGIGTMSGFVTRALKDSGLKIPVKTMGLGVRLIENYDEIPPYPLKTNKSVRFLSISSAFPRKGIDVLIKAYFKTFSQEDDVCLILKTFPNIHNRTVEQLEKLRKRYPNAPEVEHIDCDLPEEQLYGLYKAASCYVHCARGEGFGLPVAEAMLAGIPTIVCNNSGLADFCREDTCLTVGFTSVPAHSHLTENSNWYEPDVVQLSQRMREYVDNRQKPYILSMVNAAQKLIQEEFAWEVVAKRWILFIEEVRQSKERPTVDMVTTWNTKCGIAEFTRYYIENSNCLVNYRVFPDSGRPLLRPDEDNVQKRVWRQAHENDHVPELIRSLKESPSEIVHVQYNLGFFTPYALAELCRKLAGIKKVIILFHATKELPIRIPEKQLKSVVDGLNTAYKLVVHQPADAKVLLDLGVNAQRVTVIPLGQTVFPPRSLEAARRVLGVHSRHIVGSYGFLLPHKGIEKTIQAIALLREKYPDILYIASCSLYDKDLSRNYYNSCRDTIRRLHLEHNVMMFTDFLAPEESAILLQACDTMVMAYDPTNESASGAVRFCVGVKRPLITTKQSIFKEFDDCSLQILDNEPKTIASAIERMFDPQFVKRYAEKMDEHINETCWQTVVKRYMELYTDTGNSISN